DLYVTGVQTCALPISTTGTTEMFFTRINAATSDDVAPAAESQEQVALKAQIDSVAGKINEFLEELEQIGCEFKGFDQGLIDFHGRLDEREILWCWQLGEERITHWHELEAGFAGRQPLPEVLSGT